MVISSHYPGLSNGKIPQMDQKVQDIIKEESESFRQDARQSYVKIVAEAKLRPKLEEALFVISSSLAKKYTVAAVKALQEHKLVVLAGKGEFLSKLVAVVEQVKQQTPGRLVQLNQACVTDSLVNPEFKSMASVANVYAFFGETVPKLGRNSAVLENDVLENSVLGKTLMESEPADAQIRAVKKLITGPKIYQVPTMTVVLATEDISAPKGWTKQVKV